MEIMKMRIEVVEERKKVGNSNKILRDLEERKIIREKINKKEATPNNIKKGIEIIKKYVEPRLKSTGQEKWK